MPSEQHRPDRLAILRNLESSLESSLTLTHFSELENRLYLQAFPDFYSSEDDCFLVKMISEEVFSVGHPGEMRPRTWQEAMDDIDDYLAKYASKPNEAQEDAHAV